jgi:cobalt-zinc-cadmium efflux system outer membrane protein
MRYCRISPEVKIAEAGIARADASPSRAQVEKIPNINFLGGVRYNRELLKLERSQLVGRVSSMSGSGFHCSIEINVEAARADLNRAQREVDRVKLSLRSRLAAAYREFQNARDLAERYRTAMLPRAETAYDLYMTRFRQMPQPIRKRYIAQRTLFQLQEDYSDVLSQMWAKSVEIQGMLLEGALDAPGPVQSDTAGSMENRR